MSKSIAHVAGFVKYIITQMRDRRSTVLIAVAILLAFAAACRPTPGVAPDPADIDRDLLDVTIPQLHRYYAEKKYTVMQVVQWHLDRIDRYNAVYGAVETVFRREALSDAARQDTEGAQDASSRGPLWGVPIVIKANTSIKGKVTTAPILPTAIRTAAARSAARATRTTSASRPAARRAER